jgi:Cu+-exporting ATPase
VSPAILWTTDRIAAVGIGGALLIVLYVFFFGKRRPAAAASGRAGKQEITIVVSGGYSPDLIVAKRGVPLRLVFDRRESSPCSDEIVLPDFGVRRALPPFAKTAIEIVPETTGEFEFTCGMNMLHGKILVE